MPLALIATAPAFFRLPLPLLAAPESGRWVPSAVDACRCTEALSMHIKVDSTSSLRPLLLVAMQRSNKACLLPDGLHIALRLGVQEDLSLGGVVAVQALKTRRTDSGQRTAKQGSVG